MQQANSRCGLNKPLCILLLLLIGIIPIRDLQAGYIGGHKSVMANGVISGTILDNSGRPLAGATITIEGTSQSTTTDDAGRFNLTAEAGEYTLIISYVSYSQLKQAVTVRSGEATNVSLTLKQADPGLDEVVVVGYGTQKKINLTGAVASVGSEVLESRPSPNISRMLQGALPNLNLKMVDGSPTRGAAFNIRGTTSIGAGGNALVLIDGVEGDPNNLNPNDIESVSILKDASSAAIYGSRAAFGVVLITTKAAKSGKIKVDFSSSYSVNRRTVTPKVVTNGYEWAKNFDEAFNAWYDYKSHPISVNNIFPFSLEYLDALKEHNEDPSLPEVVFNEEKGRYEYFGNTDWYNVIYKDQIPATEQAVSISGGTDKVNYYVSGRYYFQDGIFNYNSDKFNKYNLRAKGDIKITPWLTFQNNFDLSNFSYKYPMFADGDGNVWRQFEHQAYPMAVIYNPDGTYSHTGVYTGVASYIEGNNRSQESNVFVRNTAAFIARPIKDLLTLKADFTYTKTWNKESRTNNFINYSIAPGVTNRFGRSLLRQFNQDISYLTSNITAEAKKKFNAHDVKVLVGYNVETSTTKNLNAQRDGILIPGMPDFNLMDGLNYNITGGGNEWAYQGLFYRVNYSFDEKYLLELNGRYDGSSKFPSNQRFGFFPSVSAGWRISEEKFMDFSRDIIDNLKLRASYGSLGNGNVAPYRYLEQMGVSKTTLILNGVQMNYTALPAVVPSTLTWEKSTTFDLGVDLAMFRNRLNISYDWYDRKTTDMFTLGQPLPATFGATVPYGNYADLSTKGWEITLGWRDNLTLAGRPFEYSFNGSLWDSKSEITRFNNPTRTLSATYYVGHQVGEIWGYETLGLFQSEEEILKHANQSFIQNSNNRQWLPGDLKFADLNGDNVINSGRNTVDDPGDRRIIGNSSPRYQFGFTTAARWNGFGISAFFQGIGKRDWYFAPEAGLFWGPYNRPYGYQPLTMMEDLWSEENPDAYFPRYRGYTALGTGRSLGAPQTRYLQDASYIRLKSLTIDYTLPKSLLRKLSMTNAQVYVTAQNLFTRSGLFRHTENFDPEVMENSVGDLTNGNGQGYAYPMLKTFTVGMNLSF
ncbi:SusC/RagA family TonB-linked outer membrane protein [Flavihumibacter stibioxidans]|nr:TonB-dependent receptor [Flavihumibacter stibioxidans]